jgi:hypothetical protein
LPPSTLYIQIFDAPPSPPDFDATTYLPSGVHSGEM